jgi:hypothetical protein
MIGIREAVRAHHASARHGTEVSAQPEQGETTPESSA